MMAQTGDTRFEVAYMPSELADKIMAEGEMSWPGEYMRERHFSSFKEAAAFAIDKAPGDFFGCTTVHKAECENGKYDWWENIGTWEVMPETKIDELDPDKPDWT